MPQSRLKQMIQSTVDMVENGACETPITSSTRNKYILVCA